MFWLDLALWLAVRKLTLKHDNILCGRFKVLGRFFVVEEVNSLLTRKFMTMTQDLCVYRVTNTLILSSIFFIIAVIVFCLCVLKFVRFFILINFVVVVTFLCIYFIHVVLNVLHLSSIMGSSERETKNCYQLNDKWPVL